MTQDNKPMKQIKQEIMEEFDIKLRWMLAGEGGPKELKQFLSQSVDKAVKQALEEVLRFLDKLEIEQPEEYKTDESWRNWKHIRNSIVDKFLQDIEEKKICPEKK